MTANNKVMDFLKETLITIIGCALMAIGTVIFLLPNQLSSGGFTRNRNTNLLYFTHKCWNNGNFIKYTVIYNIVYKVGKKIFYQNYNTEQSCYLYF